ncbi:helix-turn-helix domain-containing protein [Actinoplanes sp. NPDC049548]|uniref:TetR/AcrR family transcriptional regulator n=1 Tax=Actinoplanes sp. NPDC049548 TaxID=3155152 RepID=UPI0034177A1F
MSDERVERILDAAYACFAKHGLRRTTMDDIAVAAGMSRPAVYQYVRNKDDAFRRLADRMFTTALTAARDAAATPGAPATRLTAICTVKLELTLKIWADSPHAAELLATNTRLAADAAFTGAMHDLLTEVLTTAADAGELDLSPVGGDAGETAELLLALTRGLEADPTRPDLPHRRLRDGIALLTAGLTPR